MTRTPGNSGRFYYQLILSATVCSVLNMASSDLHYHIF